jgi:glycosyltransferase involved in cell wall biosynthesis
VRILYFSDNASNHNRRFLEKLISCGHEVHFLNLMGSRNRENWPPSGVKIVETAFAYSPDAKLNECERFVHEFKSIVKRVQPDLVHAGPVQTCAYIAALSGFHPLLVMSWGSDLLWEADRGLEQKRATGVALRAADGFFCDCDAVRSAAKEYVEIPDERIAQFPWGITHGSFGPDGSSIEKERFGWNKDTLVFISTRSWEPIYGIEVLLEAFRRAHARDDRLRLLLLGSGSQTDLIHGFLSDHGLSPFVATPGAIANVEIASWFRAADAYISCALSDGTSVSLLEAMATGLPAVVTDLAANREWITHGDNGFLATAGSPQEFAIEMLRAVHLTPLQRAAIIGKNQNMVAERADWDRNFPRLLRLYESLVTSEVPAAR